METVKEYLIRFEHKILKSHNINKSQFIQFYSTEMERMFDEKIKLEDLRRVKKRLLIYSYEDRQELEHRNKNFLESVFQEGFEENRNIYLGFSKHQFNVLIIRDPFNFLASRLKLLRVWGPQSGVNDLAWIVRNWTIGRWNGSLISSSTLRWTTRTGYA